jgi:hypothetical protein
LGIRSCLREIAISSFGSVDSRLLHALRKLLSTRSAAFLSPIEIVRLDIRWGSARFRSASTLSERNPGWDELDKILSSSPLFRRLKVVEIRVGMIIDDGDDSGWKRCLSLEEGNISEHEQFIQDA